LKKFWNKAETTNEIFIFGEIVGEKLFDSDVTAKSFADDLKSFGGQKVTLHVNSGGGDVFAATAIANVIKNYSGEIFCTIEGIAASAATIITSACDKVSICNNALLMIHNPTVGLLGYYDEAEISKALSSLSAVKSSIVTTYIDKTGKTEAEISKLMDAETWYTAREALENKFVDEISGEVSAVLDSSKKMLFVNSLQVDCKNFDVQKIKNKLEVRNMQEESLLTKIKNLLGGESVSPEPEENPSVMDAINKARAEEAARLKNLNGMRTGNKIVDAVIDAGISSGATVMEVQKYVDAVKDFGGSKVDADKTALAIMDLISDNLKSGAEGVTGSTPPATDDDKQKSQAKMLADFANGLI